MENKKILILSDSPFSNTGYSSQALFLMNRLAEKGYDIHFLAHNFNGQKLPKGCVKLEDGTPLNFTMYGRALQPYCQDLIVAKIRELKVDYFIILLDTFMVFPWLLQLDLAPAKTFFWFPTDGGGFPVNCEQVLRKIHHPIAMSKYGQKQIKELHNIDSDYIPHAVDHNLFQPLSVDEKEKLKDKWGLGGKFVVGLVGRNQGRKMHDRALKAFSKWCKKRQDAILFIHADPNDVAAVFSMQQQAIKLGIQNRIRFSGMKFYEGFPYKKMNEVYNLMDIYLSSTSGEGFGICTIEAMSCAVPIINTAFTTTDELVVKHKAGEAVKLLGTEYVNFFDVHTNEYDRMLMNGTITGTWGVERGLMDSDDCAEKLEKLYKNPELRKQYGENGRKAVLENYTWSKVTEMWYKVLQNA